MTPTQITLSLSVCVCGDISCAIPYGLCHCGCGRPTVISDRSHKKYGYIKGKPKKYYRGHTGYKAPDKPIDLNINRGCICGDPDCQIPFGYCHCGCEELTAISDETYWKWNYIKGKPKRFLRGHASAAAKILKEVPHDAYIIQDAGYDTPCWIWQRTLNNKGYGMITRFRNVGLAHRVFFTEMIGPIPDGMVLDHLCCNHKCVNPYHLDPVTQLENMRRYSRRVAFLEKFYKEAMISKSSREMLVDDKKNLQPDISH